MCCTVLIRYMALASLPEIARPSSEVVVGCTCIGTHLGIGENWPCERISVRSLHKIVANHPNRSSELSFRYVVSVWGWW